jgi:Cft2 family RNA processing exonuclease
LTATRVATAGARPDHHNTLVHTGFQARGTRGRALLEGARQVKIHGHYVPVGAEIVGWCAVAPTYGERVLLD